VRNRDWKSEETLWIKTEKTSPSGPNIHNNMGAIYQQKGDLQKAIQEFSLAIQINPGYADAFHNLANTYQQAGMTAEAVDSYKKAIEINPNLWQSHQNLAAIYYNQGWFDLSLQELRKAIEINPNDPNLKQNVELIQSSLASTAPPGTIYGSGSQNNLNLPSRQNPSSVPQP
jgi:Tfp pilus assembly protein PilF